MGLEAAGLVVVERVHLAHLGPRLRFADWSSTVGRDIFPIGQLEEGRFFLGIDETSEIYLIETWVATFGPAQEALEKLVLGISPRRIG
ncbi:SUKH-3 domain-containing protein [Streptomyces olivochromogenes]|uniref:SUKH-3 domain-containing protein n=1 Tax=Streptomyces olivochromogenes TaxID=1963 RepID=UPI001F1E2113|nr:SUKH-3 domain-containing protein [Streptomyces olivochromogenes]MCF3137220.1 SUKH-3 domain-containing protein [Streptomyces olivochromogenes]